MYIHDLNPVIQSSVTPVLMISGVGLILLSMTNRYGRVIDNARRLTERARLAHHEEKANLLAEIRIMFDRCHSLRRAIFLSCLSVLTVALLIGLLFVSNIFQLELTTLLAGLFVVSVIFLSASLIEFLLDIHASLRVLAIDVAQQTKQLELDATAGPKASPPISRQTRLNTTLPNTR